MLIDISDITSSMLQHGQTPPKDIIADGQIHRYPVQNGNGTIHGKSGWYVVHVDGPVPVGFFGDWRKGTSIKWVSGKISTIDYLEQMQVSAFLRQAEEKRKAEQEKEYAHSAESALNIYQSAVNASNDHPYLILKNVSAYPGVKQANNTIIIPVLSSQYQIQSLQYIRPDSSKKFLPKGKMKAGFFVIQGDSTILICEGYATGATLHRCTGHTVYVAFNAGNLFPVAQFVKTYHTDTKIIICGDNDKTKPENTGAIKAKYAAESIGVKCILPEPQTGSDFNDLANESSDDAVRLLFDGPKVIVLPVSKDTARNFVEPIPDHLLNPGGILQDAMDYLDTMCPVSIPIYNLAGSISLLGTIGGHKICGPTGIRTNVYCLLLGHSGSGKDGAPSLIKSIVSEIPDLMHFNGGSKFTGGAAIYSAIAEPAGKHSKLFFIDEFAKILKRERAKNNSMETVGSAFLELYSGASGYKSFADTTLNKKFPWQHVSLIGSATPDDLWAQITPTDLQDGFIARLQVYESRHKPRSAEYETSLFHERKPKSLISSLIKISEIKLNLDPDCIGNIESNAESMQKTIPFKLTRTPEALEYLKQWDKKTNENQCLYMGQWQGFVYNRARETGEKYANIHHISKYGEKCISYPIGVESYQYGLALIDYLNSHLINMAGNYVSENDWHAMEQKVLRAIKNKSTSDKPGVSHAVLFGQLVKIPERDRKPLISGLISTGELTIKKHKGKAGPEVEILCLSKINEE